MKRKTELWRERQEEEKKRDKVMKGEKRDNHGKRYRWYKSEA